MRRSLLRETNLAAAVLAALAIFCVVNATAARFWARWDWTATGLYTLSTPTREAVRGLARDVQITSFLVENVSAPADVVQPLRTVLENYARLNPRRLTVRWVDPLRDPLRTRALFAELGLDPARTPDVVVVQSGARRKQLHLADLVEFDLPGAEGTSAVRALSAESALTGAILGVTRGRQPIVRVATGHGERSVADGGEAGLSRLADALWRQDVEVEEWDALGAREVPNETDAVVVAGPSAAWLPAEREALARYLSRGGRALVMLEPLLQRGNAQLASPGLEPLLLAWGVTLPQAIVIDPKNGVPSVGPETFFAPTLGLHPVTTALGGQPLLLRLARPLELARPTPQGVLLSSLVETSDASWGETSLGSLPEFARDAKDLGGPLVVAAAAERSGSTPARLVVTGDVDFATNALLDQLSNRSFALNALAWLVDEGGALAIPPKERALARLFLTPQQTSALFLVLVIVLPAFAVLGGLAVWARRRTSAA